MIKQIPLNCLSQKEIDVVRQEAKILSSINSDFVVKYYDSFEENNKINIVMEYCDEGDLNNFIIKKRKDNKLLEESLIWNLFIKITIGLAHIHKMKILHRDLKTMNIFLKNGFQVKIGDLGVAKILLKNSFAKTLIGTPYYLSPEICQEKPYNDKSDVWALGCILYELCTFKHPFDAKSQGALILKIMNNTPESINNNYSSEIKNLISLLLEKDFEKRPSCRDILNLHFVMDKIKKCGLINYLKEYIQQKVVIRDNNNIANKVKISTKIINRNIISNINNNNYNNNKQNLVKKNLKKEISKKIENNDNSIKNNNLVKNNIQYKSNNEIKITEITFGNNSDINYAQPASNRNVNKQFLYNNFFINNEKNKYNKKLSNVIISKKNEKKKNKEKPDIISKKIGKINPFKIVLNIPEIPSKNNQIFSPKKIVSNRNNEKKFNLFKNKESVFKNNNNINIKKIIPNNNFLGKVNEVAKENLNKKSILEKEDKIKSNLSEKEINKKDNNYIIKYNKLVNDEKNNGKKDQYLINILQGKNINNNKNVCTEESYKIENFKEKESTNFEIINNQSHNSSKLSDSIENQELEDSMDENYLLRPKNQSNLTPISDLEIKNEKENIKIRDYDEENVKEIKESKNIDSKNSIKLKVLDKKEQLNKEIFALEVKIKEIKNDILNLIGEDDYKFIMDLFENNNKGQNEDNEICEEIENFSKNNFSPEKKEKFFYHYFLLLCNDSLLDKKYKEKRSLKL